MNMTTGFSMSPAALVPPALSGFAPTGEVGTFTGRGARIPADLAIVCLWAAVGLVLTGLFAGLGFGNEITQFLAAAG
jgi:hypothetical protein